MPSKKDPPREPAKLLGAILFGAGGESPVPEAEWAELVLEISNGDQSALRELYERTHRIVFTLILQILKNPLSAEEVTLDVFLDVWRHAATYDPARGSVVGWIMNQARSRAIDRLRRERRRKRVDDSKTTSSDDLETPIDPSPMEERRRMLVNALGALSIDERRAIETAYFEELTYAETAERLDTPLGTIKTRIRSGLAKLRTLLPHKKDV